MTIRILRDTEPVRGPASDAEPRDRAKADSEAGRILRYELDRYCNAEIEGRSFLIAGHRGSGKTTTVLDAIARATKAAGSRKLGRRPLPVLLHGPSMFRILATDAVADGATREPPAPPALGYGLQRATHPASVQVIVDGASAAAASDRVAAAPAAERAASSPADEPESDVEKRTRLALVQIILGLHRAATQEFAQQFERKVGAASAASPTRQLDAAELAAQFEIELLENPPASRLREFWQHADALGTGVLFRHERQASQGARELVALNGICNAHQRISGDIQAKDAKLSGDSSVRERESGAEVRGVDAFKPFVAAAAGAVAAGGAAAGSFTLLQSNLVGALFLGGVTTAATAFFLKTKHTTVHKRERQTDTTFIPDLTLRTLDRVLPTLVDRLKAAGLAPVFVVDELDKVQALSERMLEIVDYLKKLVAENVVSIFLTDRSYLEHLRVSGRHRAYPRAYSYFSHVCLVAYGPADLHHYLGQLIASPAPPPSPVGAEPPASTAEHPDVDVLKWQLRHRSRLHPLALSRALAAIRGEGDALLLGDGVVRSRMPFRIEVTLQIALELQLYASQVVDWMEQRPELRQTLIDALFYLSAHWADGNREHLDLGPQGRLHFRDYLQSRMNLAEVGAGAAGASAEPPVRLADVLSDDEVKLLWSVVEGMAALLVQTVTPAAMGRAWQAARERLPGVVVLSPKQETSEAALLGGASLLIQDDDDVKLLAPHWRYYPSGVLRGVDVDLAQLIADARRAIADIAAFETVLAGGTTPLMASELDSVFDQLADRYRVLPTTPAWSEVKRARRNIGAIEAGEAYSADLVADCRLLVEFSQRMAASRVAVQLASGWAAFVGGAAGAAKLPEAVQRGLATLSRELRFHRVDERGVQTRLAAFSSELEREWGVVPFDPGAFEGKSLIVYADAMFERGKVLRASPRWSDIVARRWDGAAAADAHPTPPASAVLCAAAGVGPAEVFSVALDAMTLAQWSTALFTAIGRADIPPWVVVRALHELGLGHLDSPTMAAFMEGFVQLAADPVEAAESLAIRSDWIVGEGLGSTAVLVVRRARASLARAWKEPPDEGLVVFALFEDLARLEPWLDKSAAVMSVVFELPPDEKKMIVEDMIESVPRGCRDRVFWMTDGVAPAGRKNETLIAPQGAEDVVAWVASRRLADAT